MKILKFFLRLAAASSLLALLRYLFRHRRREVLLTTSTPGAYWEDGILYLALPVKNEGKATAHGVRVESIQFISFKRLTPAILPVDLGTIVYEERAVLDASFAFPNESAGETLQIQMVGTYVSYKKRKLFSLSSSFSIPRSAGEAVTHHVSVEPKVALGSPFPPQPRPPKKPEDYEHEQANTPPTPKGPFRQGVQSPDIQVLLSDIGAVGDIIRSGPPEAAPSDTLVIARNATFMTDAGFPPDPSGASGGGVVFATANPPGTNICAAISTDDGLTFTPVDPSTIWSNIFSAVKDSAGNTIAGGLCCDQVVRYVASIDRFVWYQQFNNTTAPGGGLINMIRIAVAKPGDIKAKGYNGSGVWTYWDMTSATFNLGENWMDYPDMAVGDNFLYFCTNKVNTGGFVVRMPLSELRDGTTLHMNYTAAGVCAKMTRNASSELYWSVWASDSAITVYNWREDSNSYSWRKIPLASWDRSNYAAPDPAGNRWLWGVAGFFNVQGAARRYMVNPFGGYVFNELWFAWNAGIDASNSYPSIELVRVDALSFKVIQQIKIRNNEHAFAYPDLVANQISGDAAGFDVGFTFLWGGNRFYGNPGVGIFRMDNIGDIMVSPANTTLVSVGTSDFSPNGRSGDYFTVNPHWPQSGVFSAFVYQTIQDTSQPSGWRWDCRAIRFGRKSFFDDTPLPK
jgi:hypothetical protein